MTHVSCITERHSLERTVADRFLDDPNEESFAAVFKVFHPQLVSFFRARTPGFSAAEDLAQEVMWTVYVKANQIRDRTLFRGWLFKIAHNALCRHYGKLTREVETINLADVDNRVVAATHNPAGSPAFEFRDWMMFLDTREREMMMLRFVEEWEYHEIAAAHATPIGTVQWRIFNSKKKLTTLLTSRQSTHNARPECDRRKEKQNVTPPRARSEQSRKAS
jgi:RNA polymerase sigma factor (sigma-70 family)